ncbi:MAG: hypothetical protein AB8H86_29865 [Polyangiales bacterium]
MWKNLGTLTLIGCVVPTMLLSAACICCNDCDNPQPPSPNCTAEANGTITRDIEVFDVDGEWEDTGVPAAPLVSGDTVGRIRGAQGSDMVSTRIRLDAAMDSEPEGTERCMQVSYSGVSMNYTSSLIFERQGDYWVLDRQLFDPIDDGGTFTQTITVRDETLTGTSTLSLFVN